VFILFLPLQYAIQLQLLGGVWISQTIPAVILGLYTRWFNPWALIAGWFAGLVVGTTMVATTGFLSATYALPLGALIVPGYAALYSLIVNFAVAIVLSAALNPVAATRGSDQTAPGDYHFEPARPPKPPPVFPRRPKNLPGRDAI